MTIRLPMLGAFALALAACSKGAATGGLSIPHPDDSSRRVEYFIESPAGTGPWPTVVLLHGHQEGARPGGKDFVDWGVLKQLAGRGYLAVAVSQPGYGNSSGPPDYSGPFTQRAVSGVIAKLRTDGLAAPGRLLIEGISRGALTAGLVAAHDSSVTGLVLISGVYDLPAYIAESSGNLTRGAIAATMLAESGGTPDALKERSVLHFTKMRTDALILNGAKDDRTIPKQAVTLADLITANGGRARSIIYGDFGHQIPVDIRNRDIDPFIDAVLRR